MRERKKERDKEMEIGEHTVVQHGRKKVHVDSLDSLYLGQEEVSGSDVRSY